MQLFSIGGASISCSPLLLLLALFMLLSGNGAALFTSLLALSLHEGAHAFMAKGLGCELRSIELQPFGFVARLGPAADRFDELCIAAAGPLFSLLAGMACLSMGQEGGFVAGFGHKHLSIALLNLLPALPLDGGRILSAGLFVAGLGNRAAVRLGLGIAIALGILGVLLSFAGNPTLLILAVFLFFAGIRERKRLDEKRLGAYLHRVERLKKGRSLPVQLVAVPRDASLGEALRRVGGDRYTLILAVDESLKIVGSIDEGKLMERAAREGMAAKLAGTEIPQSADIRVSASK